MLKSKTAANNKYTGNMNTKHKLFPYRHHPNSRHHHRSQNHLKREIESAFVVSQIVEYTRSGDVEDGLFDDYDDDWWNDDDSFRDYSASKNAAHLESWQYDNLDAYAYTYDYSDYLDEFELDQYWSSDNVFAKPNGMYILEAEYRKDFDEWYYRDIKIIDHKIQQEFPLETFLPPDVDIPVDIADELHHELETEERFFEFGGWVYTL